MSSHVHKMEVNVPIDKVWKFVESMDAWAPLIPGYIEHEMINERESNWTFKSAFGILKKKIQLKVNITNWIEPERVTFDIMGINEKLNGHGYFKAVKISDNRTSMTGYLEITAGGKLAKVMNPLLKTSIPEMTEELTLAVGQKIEDIVNR
ncbi:CoxG family protein [Bacillus tuaregi]|uniref:CoxG family protein n=1 Tax=Bacillus tuaregi TaxID=1816695 RepID=UPI0008F9556B|nr:SRPBCC family protein [Bacillus tuaregi]